MSRRLDEFKKMEFIDAIPDPDGRAFVNGVAVGAVGGFVTANKAAGRG